MHMGQMSSNERQNKMLAHKTKYNPILLYPLIVITSMKRFELAFPKLLVYFLPTIIYSIIYD